jgi:hypothetical protein
VNKDNDRNIEQFRPAHIRVGACLLYNYKGNMVDIRHMVSEFSVFHDIGVHGTKCEMLVSDTLGLTEFLPLVGDETLVLSFGTSEKDSELARYVFRIYKVDRREKAQSRADLYALHGISQEVINSERRSVDRSYTRVPISNMVSDIHDTYIRPDSSFGVYDPNKVFKVDETEGVHSYCFPGVMPFEAMRYLCKEAMAKEGVSDFLYYETNREWKFTTLHALMNGPVVDDFYYSYSNIEQVRDSSKNMYKRGKAQTLTGGEVKSQKDQYAYRKITRMRYDTSFNTLNNIQKGLYTTIVESIDPLIKRYTTDEFTYDTDFGQLNHLEKAKVYTKTSLFADKQVKPRGSSFSHSLYFLTNYRDVYDGHSYISRGVGSDMNVDGPRRKHEFILNEHVERAQMNNMKLTVVVPGNIDLDIGNIIRLHIAQNTTIEEYKDSENILHGQRFLITAMRHTYNKEQNAFNTTLECVKDSYARTPVEDSRFLDFKERASS